MFHTLLNCYTRAKKFDGSFYDNYTVFVKLLKWDIKKRGDRSRKEVVTEKILGYRFTSYNYWTIDYLFTEIFLSKEYYFKPKGKAPVIIDCGANIGMSVLYFKNKFPDAQILAFEPNPNSYALLSRNVEENNLKNVNLYNLGLFDEEGTIPFFIDTNLSTLIGSVKSERGGNKKLEIESRKLSSFINRFEEVDLVKMDVEGAEENILNDLVESGSLGKVKEFIIEYHLNIGSTKSRLSSFLSKFEDYGYNYNIKGNFKKIKTFQDVLIHFYRNV